MSPKYRHRGYMDSDRDNDREERRPPPKQNLTEEERIQRRSLRHATNREANAVIRCHQCGRGSHEHEPVTTESVCPYCSAHLHCCRTCRHFDVSARWECRAEIDQPVSGKSSVNQCPKYEARLVLDSTGRRSVANGSGRNGGGSASGAREQFENLFKR